MGSKSDPETYRNIAEAEGIDVSGAVYIADSIKECEAAVKAGFGKVYFIDNKNEFEPGERDGYTVITDYRQVAEETIEADNTQPEAEQAEASE